MELYPIVFERDGQALTTSREVADYFGKAHKNIIQAIEQLFKDAETLNSEFSGLNFQPANPREDGLNFQPIKTAQSGGTVEEFLTANFHLSEYTDSINRRKKQYIITKDGFTLLAMGFTGAKAMQFKVACINAFNRMAGMISGAAHAAAEPERLHIAPGSSETAIFLQAIARATAQGGGYAIISPYARRWRGALLGVYTDTQLRIFADIAYSLYEQASESPLNRRELYKALEREGLAEPHRSKKPLLIKGTRRANIVLHRDDRTAGITLMK